MNNVVDYDLMDSEYEAIKTVVEHYITDEQKHFEESINDAQWQVLEEGGEIQTDHIFCSLSKLKEFITRHEDEGPRE